jgi:hypothetical protein
MIFTEVLKDKAIKFGLLKPEDEINAETAFRLVRDMPYARASSRTPITTISEWRGTCSGKHYLLKELFSELGITSKLIACTTVIHIDPKEVRGKLRKLLEQSNGRFVDVHNYLVLDLPEGESIVDATWPLSTKGMGTVVNENFVPGENHQIACVPIETWVVPEDRDPQDFKDEILTNSFTPDELEHREEFIDTISKMTNSRWWRFIARLEKWIRGAEN